MQFGTLRLLLSRPKKLFLKNCNRKASSLIVGKFAVHQPNHCDIDKALMVFG